MIRFKFRLHKIVGKWVNDDVDILPGLKFRTGSNSNESTTVTTTMLCLVWLKWGVGISVSKIILKSN
jgi:hypothetical protein